MVSWRYQRGQRSLLENLGSVGVAGVAQDEAVVIGLASAPENEVMPGTRSHSSQCGYLVITCEFCRHSSCIVVNIYIFTYRFKFAQLSNIKRCAYCPFVRTLIAG